MDLVQNFAFFATETTEIDYLETIFYVVGGLGIFLYGLFIMGESLKLLAGDKLKVLISKTTDTPLKGILVGIIVTILLQSSSGTTAITVGLVSSGLMTLPQATGVILGANIGTTSTAFIVAVFSEVPKIKDYVLPIIAIGSFLIFFSKKNKVNLVGKVMLGFGLLFYGLEVMGGPLKDISKLDFFRELFADAAQYPPFGVLVGAVGTALVQSSSATTSLIVKIYSADDILLMGALALVLGSNIGTTITGILASLGGSTEAKRAAFVHTIFNVVGSLIFLALIIPFAKLMQVIEDQFFTSAPAMTISVAHAIFNIVCTIIAFFLIKQIVALAIKAVPDRKGIETDHLHTLDHLQESLIIDAPTFALESTKLVIIDMLKIASGMANTLERYSKKNDKKIMKKIKSSESFLDELDSKTHDYLVKLSKVRLSDEHSVVITNYISTIRDVERMGDHLTNISEYIEYRHNSDQSLSLEEQTDLKSMFEMIEDILHTTLEAFTQQDEKIASEVVAKEDLIDNQVEELRKKQINRMKESDEIRTNDANFVEMLSDFERIGDHCNNIADTLVSSTK